jgi:hypothetical protein
MLKLTVSEALNLYAALGIKSATAWAKDPKKLASRLSKINKMEGLDEVDLEEENPEAEKTLEKVLQAIDAEEGIVVVADEVKKGKATAPAKAGKKKAAEPDEDDEDEDADEESDEEEDSEESDEDESDDDSDSEDDDEGDESDDDEEVTDDEEEEDEDSEEDSESEDEDDDTEDEEDEDVPTKKTDKKASAKKTAPTKPAGKTGKNEKAQAKNEKSAKKAAPVPRAGRYKKDGVIGTIINTLLGASKKKPVTKDQVVKILVKKFAKDGRTEAALRSTVNSQIPSGLRVEKNVEVQKNENGYWLADAPDGWED